MNETATSSASVDTVARIKATDFSGSIQQVEVQAKEGKAGYKASYLSWAVIVDAALQLDPMSSHEVVWHNGPRTMPNGEVLPVDNNYRLPYLLLPDGSGMVTVRATMFGVTREAFLPIMNPKNEAMTGFDARDISDSTQRCIVKAYAQHGLGLQLYKKAGVGDAKVLGDVPRGIDDSGPDRPTSKPESVTDQSGGAGANAAAVEKHTPGNKVTGVEFGVVEKHAEFEKLQEAFKGFTRAFFKGDARHIENYVGLISAQEVSDDFKQLLKGQATAYAKRRGH